MPIVESELTRSFTELSTQGVYWIGPKNRCLNVQNVFQQWSPYGSKKSFENADIDLRIGTPQLDNTHPLRDAGWSNEPTHFYTTLPIEDAFSSHPNCYI